PQDPPSPKIADEQALPSPAARPKRQAVTTARILALLKEGATIRDLAAATGWQAHSLRALLCHALPRQGYRILAEKTPGCRQKRYRLTASEPIARDPKEAAHD
ncbi:MAG: DUF3489 domain-containing protein, partial [Rhodocyclaceae bacterium]|nr:DUF3489 domain-containing protein [Rhodocyclaceae bacterium]